MADAAAASTSCARCDIFLNHRGPDVKKTFVTRLYHKLKSYGWRPFLDTAEMRPGYDIFAQIKAAIRSACVQIAIFSRNYAISEWCMKELVLMVESGALILPIFYDVDPSDLRWTGSNKDGPYAQAFRVHEEKRRYDSNALHKWRNALSLVAGRSGLELKAYNGDEDKLLEAVVQSILRMIKQKYPNGLLEKLEEIERTLLSEEQQVEARVLGILGSRGVGTTMLAKMLFFRQNAYFSERSISFLSEVRENAAITLQRQLIKDLKGIDLNIESSEEGIREIIKNLKFCHAFIVFDGVDHGEQLNAFLPIKSVIHRNSLIFVTSPYLHVLTGAGIAKSSIYHLDRLSRDHSRDLFCSYSFSQPHPPLWFENLIDRCITACNGVPLSLKLLGALLYGNYDILYWEEILNAFGQVHPNEIVQNTVRICYDSLKFEEQQILLDIACFAIGQDRDTWVRFWDGLGLKGLEGFQSLEMKCMVEVNYTKNTIKMHNLVRDYARNIAASDGSMPRRIWDPAAMSVLEQPSSDVRGIRMAHPSTLPYTCENGSLGFRNLQLLEAEGDDVESILTSVRSPNLIWLSWKHCPYSRLPSWLAMENLRVLHLSGSHLRSLWTAESQVPSQLRELNIHAPLSEIPKSIGELKYLQKIVVNFAHAPDLVTLPEEFGHLQSLTCLNLTYCSSLQHLPDSIGQLTNLENLTLSGCEKLEMLPNSLNNLRKLLYMDLSGCTSLRMLPNFLGNFRYLQYIDLSYCRSLEMLPNSFGSLTYVQEINLYGCQNLKMLPDSLGNLRNLQRINLALCKNLKMLPDSFGKLANLEYICCGSLTMFPNSLSNLTNLQRVELLGCKSLETISDSSRNLNHFRPIDFCCFRSLTNRFVLVRRFEDALTFRSKSEKYRIHPSFWLPKIGAPCRFQLKSLQHQSGCEV